MAIEPVDPEPEYPIFHTTPDGPRIVYRQAVAEPDPIEGGFTVRRTQSGEHVRHFWEFEAAKEFAKKVTRSRRRAPRANPT